LVKPRTVISWQRKRFRDHWRRPSGRGRPRRPAIPREIRDLIGNILAHDRRRVVHLHITEHPTAQWTAQQVVEALPWDTAPRFLLRDRDGVYGTDFRRRVQSMGIEEVIIAARSPWQSPYVERMIGSIRRECLDNIVVPYVWRGRDGHVGRPQPGGGN